jgi:hypothetical protein
LECCKVIDDLFDDLNQIVWPIGACQCVLIDLFANKRLKVGVPIGVPSDMLYLPCGMLSLPCGMLSLPFGLLYLLFGMLSLPFSLLGLPFSMLSLSFDAFHLPFGMLNLPCGMLSLPFDSFDELFVVPIVNKLNLLVDGRDVQMLVNVLGWQLDVCGPSLRLL